MHEVERRRTRTMGVTPWLKGIMITGATAAIMSLPMIAWHAIRTMQLVQQMTGNYNVIMRQNITLQLQTHRLTDAVNDLRRASGLPPIDAAPLVGPAELAVATRPQLVQSPVTVARRSSKR